MNRGPYGAFVGVWFMGVVADELFHVVVNIVVLGLLGVFVLVSDTLGRRPTDQEEGRGHLFL